MFLHNAENLVSISVGHVQHRQNLETYNEKDLSAHLFPDLSHSVRFAFMHQNTKGLSMKQMESTVLPGTSNKNLSPWFSH